MQVRISSTLANDFADTYNLFVPLNLYTVSGFYHDPMRIHRDADKMREIAARLLAHADSLELAIACAP